MKMLTAIGGLALAALIVVNQSPYEVDVTEKVLVTRFGDPYTVTTTPGWHFKAPFRDTPLRFDKRML